MGFAGCVLIMGAGQISLFCPPCAPECCTLLKFWQCTKLKHLLCLFTGKVSQRLGHIWGAGRMSLWCLPEPGTVMGLRVLVFLVPLAQQGANVSSAKSFLTVAFGKE